MDRSTIDGPATTRPIVKAAASLGVILRNRRHGIS